MSNGVSDEEAAGGGHSRIVRIATDISGASIGAIVLLWAADVHLKAALLLKSDFVIYNEQALAAVLGLTLFNVFLLVPARAGARRGRVPWYDGLLALAGLAAAGYVALKYPVLSDEFDLRKSEIFVVAIVVVALTLEALRRTTGLSLVVLVAVFVLYGLYGDLVPGKLQGLTKPFDRLISFLAIDHDAMLGLPMTVIVTIVLLFIFLGQLLQRSGASQFFTDLAAALMGHQRGGSAKIAVVASGLFGSISGSAVANVASTGVITIPLMIQSGYTARMAGAVEAVASTGGQILPPIMGAAAFLMAEFLEVPYTEVMIAAAIPAGLYYVSIFIQTDLEAARRGIARLPPELVPRLAPLLRAGWHFLGPFAVLVYCLFSLNLAPQKAALWAAASIVVLGAMFSYQGRRITFGALWLALRDTGKTSGSIVVIGAMAGMVIGILDISGLGFGLTLVLVELGQDNLLLLLLITAVVCVVLGMGMPTSAIYFLLATIAAPPLTKLGVEPMAAHLFVLYFGILSTITPPICMAAFTAASLSGARPMPTAITSCALAWPAYIVPFLFVFSPTLVMIGEPVDIVIAVATAIAGVWLASAGIMAHLYRPLGPVTRAAFVLAGLALLIPAGAFPGGLYLEIAGAIAAALLVAGEYAAHRRAVRMA